VKTIRHGEAMHQGMNSFVNEASVLEDKRAELVASLAAAVLVLLDLFFYHHTLVPKIKVRSSIIRSIVDGKLLVE
jgi:hypothetical protein